MLGDFTTSGSPALAILAGVALSFFAMTGFENTANVAEETIDPQKSFPRSLIGGMIVAGVIYVLVSMSAALTVDTDTLAGSDAALLEVVKSGVLPISSDFMTNLFAVIAMIAITNTTLVAVVTQPRILYGMANEDVVPGVFGKIHAGRRSPWVGLLFSGVVVSALLVVGTLIIEAGSGSTSWPGWPRSRCCSCSSSTPWSSSPRSSCAGRTRTRAPTTPTPRCCSSDWPATSPSWSGRCTTTRGRSCGVRASSPWVWCCSCSSTSSAGRTGPRVPSGATRA